MLVFRECIIPHPSKQKKSRNPPPNTHQKKKSISSPKPTRYTYLRYLLPAQVNLPKTHTPQICPPSNYGPARHMVSSKPAIATNLASCFKVGAFGRWSCQASQASHPGWGVEGQFLMFLYCWPYVFFGWGEIGLFDFVGFFVRTSYFSKLI